MSSPVDRVHSLNERLIKQLQEANHERNFLSRKFWCGSCVAKSVLNPPESDRG